MKKMISKKYRTIEEIIVFKIDYLNICQFINFPIWPPTLYPCDRMLFDLNFNKPINYKCDI